MKSVVIAREGNLSIADHLAEMRSWLGEHDIAARELVMLHVLNFRVVFRATFDHPGDADRFVAQFG